MRLHLGVEPIILSKDARLAAEKIISSIEDAIIRLLGEEVFPQEEMQERSCLMRQAKDQDEYPKWPNPEPWQNHNQ